MPGHRERARFASDARDLLGRLHMRHVNEVVLAGRGQQLRVVVEAERADGPFQARERAHTAQRSHVPQGRSGVGRAGGEVAAALVELEADAVGQVSLDVAHLVQTWIAQDEDRAQARRYEEQVALLIPRDLVHFEFELTFAGEAIGPCVDERNQVVLVAHRDALAVR